MNDLSIPRGLARYKLALYTIVMFIVMVASGEVVSRAFFSRQAMAIDPLEGANYSPGSEQYEQIRRYAALHGDPDCIFFGSSLIRTGINPAIFERAYQDKTGQTLSCYNFGVDGSSLTSTSALALIVSRHYKPKLVIVGLHTSSFLSTITSASTAEQSFRGNSWVSYSLGEFNLQGWLLDQSMLYRLLNHYAVQLFPIHYPSINLLPVNRPDVPGIVGDNGYSPMLSYRDSSPLFQRPVEKQPTRKINPDDLSQFYDLVQAAQKEHIPLIGVDMPDPIQTQGSNLTLSLASTYAQQHGFPVLSLENVEQMPATAYTDFLHMQISGSFMFSDWLGSQIGQAAAADALSRPADAVWSPTLAAWPVTAYSATLGLNQSSYAVYQSAVANFALTEPNAFIFNPSPAALDRTFAQSLVGLAIDWQGGLSDTQRTRFFQLMVVLGKMRYQNDLAPSAAASAQVDRWRSTLDPSLLTTLGIQYVLCRKELVPSAGAVEHCPTAIATTPAYKLIGSWDFTLLYERYFLYQIEPPSDVF